MSGKKKEINPIMGIRIKQLREAAKMEQQELAIKMELSKSAVSKAESGIVDISISSLEKYASIFNTTINYLLGKTNDPSPTSIDDPKRNINSNDKSIILHYGGSNNPIKDEIIESIISSDIPDHILDLIKAALEPYKK